jgi:hypothetical protein
MTPENELRPSDEVDERHLELARRAGDCYLEAADHMIEDVADTGDRAEAGGYVVGFAQEDAEGMYRLTGGTLEWEEPDEDENCHLEVIVADAADGRFVPGLEVRAGLQNAEGEGVDPTPIPFVWHPGLYHYGRNLSLPGDGEYTVTVDVKPAEFPRHDRENGDRYAEPVEVQFGGVRIETGSE